MSPRKRNNVDDVVRELASLGVPASQVRELCGITDQPLTDTQAMRLHALHALAKVYQEVADDAPKWARRLYQALDEACALGVAYEPPACVAVVVADAAKWVRGAAKMDEIRRGKR